MKKEKYAEIKNRLFRSIEEIKLERERLIRKYGDIPDFAKDFLDLAEERLETRKKYSDRKGRHKFRDYKWAEEEFWKKNKLRISKMKANSPEQKDKLLYDLYEEDKKLQDIEIRHIIQACESRLDAFAKFYFPHYLKKPNSKFHKFLYKTLPKAVDSPRRRARWAIAAPRSSGKSTIINCIFPIWCIVYNKKKFIILVSKTVNQSIDFLSDIKKELEGNMRLQRDFPYACGKGAIWRADEIITRNDVKVLALGTGSQIRGRRFGTERPGLFIGDDLEATEMVRSEAQREAVREWFNKDVLFVGGEANNLDIFIIGTVIGHEALLNKLMDPNIYPDFKSIRFKAVEKFSDSPLWDEWARIYTDSTDKDRIEHARQFYLAHEKEMLRGTKVLWPEGDPYYDNMVAKLTDPSAFLQEKQNESIDLTKVKIKKEEMAFIDLKANAHLLTGLPRYGALDPSLGKKTSSGDYSVITTLAWNKETSTAYVIDINMKRRSVDKQIQDVIKLFERHEWRLFGVETTAFQYVLAELLRKETKKLGMFLPIKEIDSKKDKLMRFESLFPFMRDGTIVFDGYKYERQAMYRDAVDQILYYTGNKNDRDDVLDSLEMCFSLVKGKRFKLLTRPARGSRIIR